MNRKKISKILTVITTGLLFSCTTTDKTTDPEEDLYVNIPDAKFEKKLISLNIDSDGLINQKLLKTDAEKITYLDLTTYDVDNISDLTGIEGFINLKRLDATQNKIATINLISNTLLDTIYLGGNQITNIDLSENLNLISIDIQSNELTSFVAPTNEATHLEKINLSFNLLKEFTVHNESIKTILISDNDLTSFDASGSTNLNSIFLKSNKITSLDLSTNVAIKTVVVSDNKIENINLDNDNITHFYISSNLLTSLNVENLPGLVELKIKNNPDLTCVKIGDNQNIPALSKSDDQEVSSSCD